MQQVDESMIGALLDTARDEAKEPGERYAAVQHACKLRGDAYLHVPIDQLRFVAAGMGTHLGMRALPMREVAAAVEDGFRRAAEQAAYKR